MNHQKKLIKMEDYKIALKCLKEIPETWNEIRNASFAYQFLPGEHEKAHQFFGQDRESKCLRCNRTREDVRWNYHLMHSIIN